MAFPRSYSDSALSADVQRDANPGADSSKFRSLLIKISRGLGENDMEKLKYLCRDLGVALCSFEKMTRGTHLFRELEKLELIKAEDISLLVALMEAINRCDLVTNLKSWSSKEGNLAHKLSSYRRLMLRISDSLSPDERGQFTFYISGGNSPFPVAAIEECKSLLKLFVLMEKNTLIGPEKLEYLTDIMQSIGNIAIVKEIEKYLAIVRSSVHNIQPSSSSKFQAQPQPHQGGRVAYNTGNQSNMRSNSAPTLEVYTQNPSCGRGYQGTPPLQQQQPYHNYPQQQYHQPQHQATPSYSQQNPQQWQHGQQPAIKTEPEDRTSSAPSGLAVGSQMPPWYYEAVQKHGAAYAVKLWENVVQTMRDDEVRKKMQEMKIAEQRRAAESMPSVKMEPGGDKWKALDISNFHLDTLIKENTTGSPESEQSSTLTNEGQIGPSQTAADIPHPNTESEQSSTLTNEGHMIEPAQTATVIPHPSTDSGHIPDLLKYKMDRVPRGMCIIFNVENFSTKSNLKKRDGTQKDVEALLNTFQENLKFITQVKKDPTKREYVKCLQEIANMDHSEYDCFVCVILSHGSNGHVCDTNGVEVSIDTLTGIFRGDYAPSLVDKPKLFFIQACQGKYSQDSVDIQQDDIASLPFKSDTLVSHATIPGYASFRNANSGSLFIISLCNIINTYYKEKVDLLSMLTMVNERMSRRDIEVKWMGIGKQIGNPSHCLRKQIFFNEGLDE